MRRITSPAVGHGYCRLLALPISITSIYAKESGLPVRLGRCGMIRGWIHGICVYTHVSWHHAIYLYFDLLSYPRWTEAW